MTMTDFDTLKHTRQVYLLELDKVKNQVLADINSLPDNPDIIRNDKSFIIQSKSLFGQRTWNVYFYDWKAQFKDIAAVIEDYFDGRTSRFNTLYQTRKIKLGDRAEDINPLVFEHVKPILDKLHEFNAYPSTGIDL